MSEKENVQFTAHAAENFSIEKQGKKRDAINDGTGPQFSMEGQTVSNLGELQSQHPDVYQKFLEGIAMKICNEMKQDDAKNAQKRKERERESKAG